MINKLHPNKIPYLLVYDNKGNIYEDKRYYAVGQTGNNTVELTPNDFIELPFGSDLFFLPGRNPIGKNIKTGEIEIIDDKLAVSAFVAPAYTVTHHAAWNTNKNAPRLPLFAYSAVGWLNNKFYVPAIRIESDIRQDCEQFDQKKVISGAKKILKLKPENRLIKHLSYCALEYFCPAARNYFLNRWEAPLPTSPTCNSQCLGCISYQPKEHEISSTQNRITFVPTAQEIAEIAILAADEVKAFDITPSVAMLSFSDFGSVKDEESIKMRKATMIVNKLRPDIQCDGEMTADTAVDFDVLSQEYPFTTLQSRANVLIFPNLSSGNIMYKLMSKLAAASVIGPIMLGMNKPVHLLQRNASVDDIINMSSIAVVDAAN